MVRRTECSEAVGERGRGFDAWLQRASGLVLSLPPQAPIWPLQLREVTLAIQPLPIASGGLLWRVIGGYQAPAVPSQFDDLEDCAREVAEPVVPGRGVFPPPPRNLAAPEPYLADLVAVIEGVARSTQGQRLPDGKPARAVTYDSSILHPVVMACAQLNLPPRRMGEACWRFLAGIDVAAVRTCTLIWVIFDPRDVSSLWTGRDS